MGKLKGPRRDGAAYNALLHLAHLGGTASANQLTTAVLSYFRSAKRFDDVVMVPLLRFKLVRRVSGDEIQITAAGLAFIKPANKSDTDCSTVAGPVEPRPFKALSPEHLPQRAIRREGADTFRAYPSLMGGVRVPYWGKV